MNPKFIVGERVILQSISHPELNGEHTVEKVLSPNKHYKCSITGKIYLDKSEDNSFGYVLDLGLVDEFSGTEMSWEEYALKKKPDVKYGNGGFLWFVDESTCSGIENYQLLGDCKHYSGKYICTRKEFEDRVEKLNNMKKWNGEGLPPVGEDIEYTTTQYQLGKPSIEVGKWYRGKIIAYYNGAVWTSDNGIRLLDVTKFRPIKSERDKALEYVDDKWREHNDGVSGSQAREFFAILYDAGMLKLPDTL